MPPSAAPPTWRLLELLKPSGLPCPACDQVRRYLMTMTPIGGRCARRSRGPEGSAAR
jgi:hypothetical protein